MYKLSSGLLLIAILAYGCGTNTPNNQSSVSTTDTTNASKNNTETPKPATGAAVETQRPNTDYKPAFAGQTRIAGVQTSTPYEGTVISSDLKRPWGITALPDGRLLITEKGGSMRIATTSGTVGAPITGLPAVNAAGQGGLLGLTLDPAFGNNRMVYWTFSESTPDGNLTSVAKGKLSDDETKIENAVVIYRATPAYNGNLHYG
ncbi:MAG: PQQ-dependent sugar dehydrogenase, partial [Chitinophagaceae bacterium]